MAVGLLPVQNIVAPQLYEMVKYLSNGWLPQDAKVDNGAIRDGKVIVELG